MSEPLDLEPIKARTEAASEGPWVTNDYFGEVSTAGYVVARVSYHDPGAFAGNERQDEDAEFIAHARTDVPRLVEEVERLRAELAGAVSRIEADLAARESSWANRSAARGFSQIVAGTWGKGDARS